MPANVRRVQCDDAPHRTVVLRTTSLAKRSGFHGQLAYPREAALLRLPESVLCHSCAASAPSGQASLLVPIRDVGRIRLIGLRVASLSSRQMRLLLAGSLHPAVSVRH